jgi:hypothetical protein
MNNVYTLLLAPRPALARSGRQSRCQPGASAKAQTLFIDRSLLNLLFGFSSFLHELREWFSLKFFVRSMIVGSGSGSELLIFDPDSDPDPDPTANYRFLLVPIYKLSYKLKVRLQ